MKIEVLRSGYLLRNEVLTFDKLRVFKLDLLAASPRILYQEKLNYRSEIPPKTPKLALISHRKHPSHEKKQHKLVGNKLP